MSDAQYIRKLEKEIETLRQTLVQYMDENWQSSITLGLIEGEHYYNAKTYDLKTKSGDKKLKFISRKFTSLLSMRNFIKSQSTIQDVYVLFCDDGNIYHSLTSNVEILGIPDTSYILRFAVSNKT